MSAYLRVVEDMHGTVPPRRSLKMSDPATLWRRRKRRDGDPVIVATGPFVILAHGLLAIPPERRDSFWIGTDAGDIRPDEAEALRLAWMRPASAA